MLFTSLFQTQYTAPNKLCNSLILLNNFYFNICLLLRFITPPKQAHSALLRPIYTTTT